MPVLGFLRAAEAKVTSSVISPLPSHFYVVSHVRALVCCTVDHSYLTNLRGVTEDCDREEQ